MFLPSIERFGASVFFCPIESIQWGVLYLMPCCIPPTHLMAVEPTLILPISSELRHLSPYSLCWGHWPWCQQSLVQSFSDILSYWYPVCPWSIDSLNSKSSDHSSQAFACYGHDRLWPVHGGILPFENKKDLATTPHFLYLTGNLLFA